VSTIQFFGIVCFSASCLSTGMYAQLLSPPGLGVTAEYPAHVTTGTYSIPVLAASGEDRFGEEYGELEPGIAPAVLNWPERSAGKPTSSVVSLHDLEHPIPKKAIRQAYEAQRLARANEIPKAIAKLESALRLDPSYRDAHVNLGVQFTRLGRNADARAEFQKAVDIGPPAAPIYSDLAVVSLALHQSQDADHYAHKALELDPENSAALNVLQFASTH